MAKILFAYRRKGEDANSLNHWQRTVETLDRALVPDQDYLRQPSINLYEGGNYLYIFSPVNDSIIRKDFHLCVGSMISPKERWWEEERVANTPLSILHKRNEICIYADILGSRCFWFYQDEHVFLASTSQRAMVIYLQSFMFNAQAATWMLATGCSGPGYGWDKRFRAMGPGGTLHFDKKKWKLKHENRAVSFTPGQGRKEVFKGQLANILEDSINKVNFDFSSSVLTLSGGYDSRAALYYLKDKIKYTLSWGVKNALRDGTTDAYIAQKLAERLQKEHNFYETDKKDLEFESIVHTFIKAGEGRVDHIQTHTDGFDMWARIADRGFNSVVRADEVFGWLPVQNELDTRLSVAFNYLNDFANLKPAEAYGLEPQMVPDFYHRREQETIEGWRDRLYQQYRIPYIQTGLHDLIYPFVELLNPLLLDEIVNFTHSLPSEWRTSKNLYAGIIKELISDIPFASKSSIPEVEHVVKDPEVVELMKEEIRTTDAQHYISPVLVREIIPKLRSDSQTAHQVEASWKMCAKKMLPFGMKKLLRHSLMKYKADENQLAFRNYLIVKVASTMREDALLVKKSYE